MRVAAVQMTARPDPGESRRVAEGFVRAAADVGARLVALPELFTALGRGPELRAGAEPLEGPTSTWAGVLAAELGLWMLAGSFVERVEGPDGPRFFNTSCLVSPSGALVASYRKIHLFDVDVPGAGMHESDVFSAGEDIVTAEVDGTRFGLTTCYDLRFPEVYRILALRGATVVTLPSAFVAATGPAHWELLIRARAVEDQVFVVAPNQCGSTPDGTARYGHSVVVDPWGEVLAAGGDDEEVIVADLDPARLTQVRDRLPSLANRRPATYRWPS